MRLKGGSESGKGRSLQRRQFGQIIFFSKKGGWATRVRSAVEGLWRGALEEPRTG